MPMRRALKVCLAAFSVFSLAMINPDVLASGSGDHTIKLWDVKTQREIAKKIDKNAERANIDMYIELLQYHVTTYVNNEPKVTLLVGLPFSSILLSTSKSPSDKLDPGVVGYEYTIAILFKLFWRLPLHYNFCWCITS